MTCSSCLEFPAADRQTAKDTQWLLRWMSRASTAESPAAEADADKTKRSRSEILVREMHAAIKSRFFSAAPC